MFNAHLLKSINQGQQQKFLIKHLKMPKYNKSERTARKARKIARQEAAADAEQVQQQEQAAMQARLEQLMADNALLKKKQIKQSSK